MAGKGIRIRCKQGHLWTPQSTYWRLKSNGKRYRECLVCKASRERPKARERKVVRNPEPVLGTEAEIKRSRTVQELHDRLTGTGFPMPLAWERAELLKQLEEVTQCKQ
jgi:hypothetical protein